MRVLRIATPACALVRNDRFSEGYGGRVVGEIAEAPPVAEEARRFRGSAPIGGCDSRRESDGTTAGNRRPLRGQCVRDDVGIVHYGGITGSAGRFGGRPALFSYYILRIPMRRASAGRRAITVPMTS